MKSLTSIFAALFVFFAQTADAYYLPKYTITSSEWQTPAEDILSGYESDISQSESFFKLKEHDGNSKVKLSSDERALYRKYKSTQTAIQFWNYAVNLKKAIFNLEGADASPQANSEADAMAKTIVQTLYSLSQKYKVGSSAYLNNVLINAGIKKEGFCYHYVGALKSALSGRQWKFFDIYWGGAREGTRRENNTLVITAKGRPFDTGLAIDAWRKAGRPFWTNVKGDRYPWVKSDYD